MLPIILVKLLYNCNDISATLYPHHSNIPLHTTCEIIDSIETRIINQLLYINNIMCKYINRPMHLHQVVPTYTYVCTTKHTRAATRREHTDEEVSFLL